MGYFGGFVYLKVKARKRVNAEVNLKVKVGDVGCFKVEFQCQNSVPEFDLACYYWNFILLRKWLKLKINFWV